MNRKPFDSDLREAVTTGVSAVEIPAFDLAAIQARKGSVATYYPAKRVRFDRWALVALPAVLVLALIVPSMPAVVAQVERALHAFAVVNGQTIPLTVRTVSLDEARAHMPFEVIAPAAVPPGLKLTINAMYSEASAAPARLIFEYSGNGEIPVLRIEETAVPKRDAAGATTPTKVVVSERTVTGGPARGNAPAQAEAPLPNALPRGKNGGFWVRSVKVVNGRVSKQTYELHPIMWSVRGTQIMLAPLPGTLSNAQVDAIRATMSQ